MQLLLLERYAILLLFKDMLLFLQKKKTPFAICYCIMSYIKSDLRIVVINGKKKVKR